MAKIVRRLLAIFLILATNAKALADTCYTPEQMNSIADELQRADRLTFELQEYKKLHQSSVETAWYHDPTLVVGSVVISLSVGVILGYAIGRGK